MGIVSGELRAAVGLHAVRWLHFLVTRFASLLITPLITPLFVTPAGALDQVPLCTSKQQVTERLERVQAFRTASLKGWEYALAHKDEIVDLIRQRYRATKSREAPMYEAARTELLIHQIAALQMLRSSDCLNAALPENQGSDA
jgi:hypothetical protein